MQRTTSVDAIDPNELHRMMAEGDVLLLDVREPSEHAAWKIPGSVNVPLGTLAAGATVPPSERTVVYCATGPRSETAQRILAARGIQAPFLRGGMTAWNGVYQHVPIRSRAGADVVQLQRVGKGCLSYLVVKDGEAVVIDPTMDIEEYTAAARARDARIIAVVDTHAHADHASGGRILADAVHAPYYAPDEVGAVPHVPLRDGARIVIGSGAVRVMETPGHTPGSVTLLHDDLAFTGDTLFVDSVGRPDLGQDPAVTGHTLWATLQRRLLALPPATRVLPGHRGDASPDPNGPVVASLADLRERVAALSWDEGTFVAWVMRNTLPKPANFETIKKLNQGQAKARGLSEIRMLEAGPNGCAVSG